MTRKMVAFFILTGLLGTVLLHPSNNPSGNNSQAIRTTPNAVVAMLNTIAPTGQCQDVLKTNCALVRSICYTQAVNVFDLCMAITQDLNRCNREMNENYQSCAGECY